MTLAFVFPGQGSQKVGMLDTVADEPVVQHLLKQAHGALGQDLGALIAAGPAEDLALTVNTQPAMLVASLAFHELWRARGGPQAHIMAGHSLGEYTALTAAGVFSASDAVALVRTRAQAMQSAVAVGEGGMAAILGLDDAAVLQACAQAQSQLPGRIVQAVNFNAPAQVVIAGHADAVSLACELLKAAGAKRALLLPVSAPFHSSLMAPAGLALKTALEAIPMQVPQAAVINNVDVGVEHGIAGIRDALVRQASSPVQWVQLVRKMAEMGVTEVIEFGPGKVLSGLVERIEKSIKAHAVYDKASLDKTLETLGAQERQA